MLHHADIVAVGARHDDQAVLVQRVPVHRLHPELSSGGRSIYEQSAIHGNAPGSLVRASDDFPDDHVIADRNEIDDLHAPIGEGREDVGENAAHAGAPGGNAVIDRVVGIEQGGCFDIMAVDRIKITANDVEHDAAAAIRQLHGQFNDDVAVVARKAVKKLRARFPSADVHVYDNYNALAVGFGPTEKTSQATFSIAVYSKYTSLFFPQSGAVLKDPTRRLEGTGGQARHIKLNSADDLDAKDVIALTDEALASGKGKIVIKSTSAKTEAAATAAAVISGWNASWDRLGATKSKGRATIRK